MRFIDHYQMNLRSGRVITKGSSPEIGASLQISGGRLRGRRSQVREVHDEEIGHTRLGATSCPTSVRRLGREGRCFNPAAECDVEYSKDRA
jgi:hypothetical protein